MIDESKMRRLATIRYMHHMAIEQSTKPEPLNVVAVLLFHDAVELFLALVSEHLNAGKTGQSFMEYWEAINSKLPRQDFAQKDAMKRLNTARTGFKHSGILPSKSEIDTFRISVTAFFNENAEKIFGILFDTISMASLVRDDAVRQSLEGAEVLVNQGDTESALKKIAIAFQQLTYNFEWRVFNEHNSFPFDPLRFSRLSSIPKSPPELASFAKDVEKAVDKLQEQIKILSLGIDYRRYVQFRMMTPPASLMASGEYQAIGSGKALSPQEYNFCYGFVIENALRLQEFVS